MRETTKKITARSASRPPSRAKRRSQQQAAVTIVVPTRNERDNVAPLVARLEETFAAGEAQIIFVDDSSDETPAAVEAARASSSLDIRLIHREEHERDGGLGGAVLAGLAEASAPWVCVMDGDLQHPPELIPAMLEKARAEELDLVVASRYASKGSAGGFGAARSLLSKVSTGAARITFPLRLREIHDPMSGFFLVRRDAVDARALRPRGFKILLEIVARTGRLRTAEVPFTFGERYSGDSKASVREGVIYLSQLARLRVAGALPRFGLVGASGLIVNMLVFALLATGAGLNYLLAAAIATQASTLSNFLLTEGWVFGHRTNSEGRRLRGLLFFGMNNATLVLRAGLLVVLIAGLAVDALIANFISLVALAAIRFAVADRVIWRDSTAPQLHSYSVHGIVSVQSEVALPELALFRVDDLTTKPTIRVRIGKLSKTQSSFVTELAFLARHIRYDEGLGKFGFGIEVAVGRSTEILASPLLRHSPHVLYTNVVEPIMRWTLAKKGYALVHAACVADGDDAYLITARTDTGKTTTILKMLDSHPFAFLSDDLTLLAPDGTVLTYPKPLTISRHTVAAVKTPLLTRWERTRLLYQSRLHSRSGRQFAMLLAQTGLPVATINALVQLIVPPPKYHVDRLVPEVEVVRQASFKGMFVIERGTEDRIRRLDAEEAVATLLANSEDAFGFPPYPYIEHFLHSGNGRKLKEEEASIVASALAGAPATVVSSATMDWFERLPELMGVGVASGVPVVEPVPALRLVVAD